MYTFIGRPQKNLKKFKTIEGYILTFKKDLPLFEDFIYVILCSRDEKTGVFTFIRSIYGDKLILPNK